MYGGPCPAYDLQARTRTRTQALRWTRWRGGPGTEEFIYILVTVVEPGEPENPLLNPGTASRQEGAARSTGLQSHFILTSRASGCGATRGETNLPLYLTCSHYLNEYAYLTMVYSSATLSASACQDQPTGAPKDGARC